MSHVQRWYSRSIELPTFDHDRLVILSSALSYKRASEGAGLRVVEVVGYWRVPLR